MSELLGRTGESPSALVRAGLGHPVIDVDGHTLEFLPALAEHLHKAGADLGVGDAQPELDRLLSGVMSPGGDSWFSLSQDERMRRRMVRSPWWGLPARNTLDLATATFPRLLHERLGEAGLDFSVVFGSIGPGFAFLDDERLRRAACRAVNSYHAEAFAPYADRLAPVAVIPMHTPAEAIEELEHAVDTLGFKAAVFAGYVKRPVAALDGSGDLVGRYAYWLDTFGIDSLYDYDPLWRRCVELGIPFFSHSGGMGWGSRQSISNYMYNHIGHFASAGEALCKSLFLGGVTRRFPGLRFAFLEGGVAWATSLYADLVGHWEKRNADAVGLYDPAGFDAAAFDALKREYGDRSADLPAWGHLGIGWGGEPVAAGERDEWAACAIERREDLRDLFVSRFFFGCEADDPMTSVAFRSDVNPLGARLGAVFSSDIGHWDVPDLRAVLHEAYEPVERGWITEADFREFVYENPVRLLTDMNPDFFTGTAVEGPAAEARAARKEHGR